MVGHDDGGVKDILTAVVVQAMAEDCVSSFGRKGFGVSLAEGHKYCPAGFLMVRQHAAVIVHSVKREALEVHGLVWLGHSCPRLLIFLIFDLLVCDE
jgi:hypothetical protein